jgi:hypothetical protein
MPSNSLAGLYHRLASVFDFGACEKQQDIHYFVRFLNTEIMPS